MDERQEASGESALPVPWLSYLLIALCVGAFLLAQKQTLEAGTAVDAPLARAEAFLLEHPYLEPPPLLARRLSAGARARHADAAAGKAGAAGVLSRLLAREQAELDALVAPAEARLERLPARRYGLRASEPTARAVWSHVLVHGGWLHLLGNLLLLGLLGSLLEGAYRRGVYPLVMAVGVAGSALAWVLLHPAYPEPLIGTGGLLAGLLGAFAVRHRADPEGVPFGPVLVAATIVLALPVCLGFEWSVARGAAAAPARAGALNPSLASLAGGLLGGLAAAGCARLLGLERRRRAATTEMAARSSVLDPRFQRALDLQRVGDLDAAFNLLTGVLRRFPDDFDASTVLWEVASQLGRPRAASGAVLRVIREEIQRGDCRNAVRHWLEMVSCELDVNADTALLLHMAPLLRQSGHFDEASGALRAALERSRDGAAAPRIAARVAREAAGVDLPTARDAAWRALGSPELGLEERQELEELLGEIEPHVFDDADESAQAPEPVSAATVSGADLMQPDEAEASIAATPRAVAPSAGPSGIELEESDRVLECLLGVPVALDVQGVILELEGGLKKRVPFSRIEAIAVAAVDGLGEKTVLVVDLVLNWVSLTGEPLRLIRLRTDRFDPRQVVPGAGDPLQALRTLVARLLEASEGLPLPDHQSATGTPFAAFRSLAEYQAHVLMVGEDRGA